MATTICGSKILLEKSNGVSPCEESFSICMPFGAHLDREGGCLSFTPADNIPEDGEYSRVIIKNGCIMGVRGPEDPIYTSAPCTPIPQPCDCGGGSGGIEPSSLPGNLFSLDATGKGLALLNTRAGEGITVSGSGTETDPLVIAAKSDETMKLVSGTPAVLTVDSIEGGYSISHVETKSPVRTINGMTFDTFGHLSGYDEPASLGYLVANQILAGTYTMVTIDNTGPTVTIDLKDTAVRAGEYLLGGMKLNLSNKGTISTIDQGIKLTEGVYTFGDYNVTVNQYGSITDISVVEDVGAVTHSLTKKIPAGVESVSVNFVLSAPSGLRISIKSTNVPDCTVMLDGNYYTGDKIGNDMFEIVTNATFSAGQHTLDITPSAAFSSIAIIDVILNTVV